MNDNVHLVGAQPPLDDRFQPMSPRSQARISVKFRNGGTAMQQCGVACHQHGWHMT
jgi:hypothetical protein